MVLSLEGREEKKKGRLPGPHSRVVILWARRPKGLRERLVLPGSTRLEAALRHPVLQFLV